MLEVFSGIEKFLKENKDKMSGLTFREGRRKLPEKYKRNYR